MNYIARVSSILLALGAFGLLVAASAFADAPPAVTIGSPTNIGPTTVKVHGTVNPEGGPSASSWHFEYNTDPAGGGSWEASSSASGEISGPAAEGSSPIAVEGTIEGLEAATGYSVRLVASNEGGTNTVETQSPYPTFTTEAFKAPLTTAEAPSDVGAHSATLHGKVNPNGTDPSLFTQWFFECTPVCGGNGAFLGSYVFPAVEAEVPVEFKVNNGFEANRSYEVGLVAENGGGTTTSTAVTFKTDAIAPEVETVPATAIPGGTKARLGAKINADNQPTTYFFEYGATTDYGKSLPASEDASAGSSGEFQFFTLDAGGLSPQTTYHYRVVAHNDSGTSVGEDRTIKTLAAGGPPAEECSNTDIRALQHSDITPECRAWEMATPIDKNNLDAGATEYVISYIGASESGEKFVYFADGAFGNAESSQPGNPFIANRLTGDWLTDGILPVVDVTTSFGNRSHFEGLLNPDLSKTLVMSIKPTLTAAADPAVPNLYIKDLTTGGYQLVTVGSPTNAPAEGAEAPQALAVTPDFKRVIFYSPYAYTSDAPATPVYNIYEWSAETNSVRLLGERTDESFSSEGAFLGGQSNSGVSGSLDHALSEDGSRVYYNVTGESGIYLQEDGGTPTKIAATGQYWSATPDGSKALYTTRTGVFVYDADTGESTNIAPDGEPTEGEFPDEMSGIVANSDDLSTVYFITRGRYTADTPANAVSPMYVSNDGVLTYIADVGSDSSGLAYDGNYPSYGNRDVSADGHLLAFQSSARLTAGDNDGRAAVYLYNDESGELLCASCRPDGSPNEGNAVLKGKTSEEGGTGAFATLKVSMSNITADGTRLFFETADSLLPEDSNGANDIYVWKDGEVRLATPGTGNSPEGTIFLGATPSGSDIYFATRNRIAGIDIDELNDIYDSRVEGGIASQFGESSIAECQGEQCRGASTQPPTEGSPVSREITGARNATPPKKCKKNQVKKNGKCVKKKPKKQKKGKKKSSKRSQGNG